jgi:probable F420-dependent oxidoreductase
MRFDIEIPTCSQGVFVPSGSVSAQQVVECIQVAERLGYHGVWGSDFIAATPPAGVPTGEYPDWYEPLLTLAYAAAVTHRIKLGTGLVVLPNRDPVILAKQVATLDRLANGRFALGVGIGAWREELAAIAAWRDRPHRGDMLTEYVEVIRRLLDHEAGPVSFNGRYTSIRDVELHPKPIQAPLPIYMPGRNPSSLERIARFGDGLMVLGTRAAAQAEALSAVLESHGRGISEFDVVAEAELHLGATHDAAVAGYRRTRLGRVREASGRLDEVLANNWIGTAEEAAEAINRLADQGIDHVNVLHVAADTLEERLELMHRFAEDVMPLVA